MAPASNDPPGAIAPPPGCFPQPQVRHQILRGARCDVEFFRNHPGRDDRPAHHIVDEGGQPGGGAAAGELARQQGAGGGPALVLLEPGLGGRREGVDEGDEARGLVTPPGGAPAARRASPMARQTRWALLLPRARSSAGISRRPSQGLCCSGAICSQASSARAAARIGGRAAVCRDDGAPVGQAFILVPVEIIDQRIAGFLPQRGAGQPLRGAADGGLDGGEGVREQPIRSALR